MGATLFPAATGGSLDHSIFVPLPIVATLNKFPFSIFCFFKKKNQGSHQFIEIIIYGDEDANTFQSCFSAEV